MNWLFLFSAENRNNVERFCRIIFDNSAFLFNKKIMNYSKYPRTPHLTWSEGMSDDDITLWSESDFIGKNVVVTEKVVGENTNMYSDHFHARSMDSKDHPTRHLAKAIWSQIKHEIPKNIKICGENVFAKHSIYYESLPSVLLIFAVIENDTILSWKDTLDYCDILQLQHVPVLYEGIHDKDVITSCYTGKSAFNGIQEGYVVRNSESFLIEDFQSNIAKYVRKNHVQTSEHWLTQKIVPNGIIS